MDNDSSTGPKLVRGLKTWDVTLITFSTIVGSAIFIAASIVPRAAPDPTVILLLWAVGGLVTLAGVFTYAELGTMFPEAGGQYQFLKEAYGPLWGFLFGWTSFLVIQSGAIAYLAVAAAQSVGGLWPSLGTTETLLTLQLGGWTLRIDAGQVGGALLIAAITFVNYFGLQAGAGLQNAIAAVKIVSLLALIVFGLAASPADATTAPQAAASSVITASSLGVAMIGVLWCFDGWYQAAFCAGEIRDPARSLPRGMILGTFTTAILFVLINVVYLRALPPHELGEASRVGEAAALSLFGAGPARLMSLAVLIAIVGCLATCILTAARIYLPMAQDGLFFNALGKVHPVHLTPGACLIAQAAWSILLTFTGSYEQLGTYVIFAVFVFHAATGAAIFVLRRTRPDSPRPYRAWGYPWTPAVFILTSLVFVISTLVERPIESLWGLGIVVLGVPAYAWWRRGRQAQREYA
ncbi:MAG TPA: amino acid permease [Steroidobacteraceae bacterium]|nr:amino acid permease [Steroidobacteraceae bacterium]